MMTSNKLVSIVDDEQDITILFLDALMSIKGITVFTFTDPLLALEHFQMNDRTYVLVISDFRMPGLNGMELLKKMKDMNKFVRTILMTALDIDDNIFQNFTKRKIVNALVQKPTKLFDLTKDVDTQLHSFEMLKRYRSQ
jgi:DNA-binding NtrC family response regulator